MSIGFANRISLSNVTQIFGPASSLSAYAKCKSVVCDDDHIQDIPSTGPIRLSHFFQADKAAKNHIEASSTEAESRFGEVFKVSDDLLKLVAAAPGQEKVYFFEKNELGNWEETGVVSSPLSNIDFGCSLVFSLDKTFVLIGARTYASSQGRVYMYRWTDATLVTVLESPNGQPGDAFGTSLSVMEDGTYLMGAPGVASGAGRVYAFSYSEPSSWTIKEALAPEGSSTSFGSDVSSRGTNILVGCDNQFYSPQQIITVDLLDADLWRSEQGGVIYNGITGTGGSGNGFKATFFTANNSILSYSHSTPTTGVTGELLTNAQATSDRTGAGATFNVQMSNSSGQSIDVTSNPAPKGTPSTTYVSVPAVTVSGIGSGLTANIITAGIGSVVERTRKTAGRWGSSPPAKYLDADGINVAPTSGLGSGWRMRFFVNQGNGNELNQKATILSPGNGYQLGDQCRFSFARAGATTQDAVYEVTSVSETGGEVSTAIVIDGGQGYAVGDTLNFEFTPGITVQTSVSSITPLGLNLLEITSNGIGYSVGEIATLPNNVKIQVTGVYGVEKGIEITTLLQSGYGYNIGDELTFDLKGSVHPRMRVTGNTKRLGNVSAVGSVQAASFGKVLGMSKSTRCIVGAPEIDKAFIYDITTYPPNIRQELTPPIADGIRFGSHVAIDDDGNHVCVSGPAGNGAVFVYGRGASGYKHINTVHFEDVPSGGNLGKAVQIVTNPTKDELSIITCAPDSYACCFDKPRVGRIYEKTIPAYAELPAETSDQVTDLKGGTVTTSGNAFYVSADTRSNGQVFIFEASTHVLSKTIVGDTVESLGSSMKVSADSAYLVVGAPAYADEMGRALIYKHSGSTWSEHARLQASDGTSGDRFGASCSIDDSGTYAIIGAPRASKAYVYKRVLDTWTQQSILRPHRIEYGDGFGCSVCFTENAQFAIVGAESRAPEPFVNHTNYGTVHVFKRSDTDTWTTEYQEVHPSDVNDGMKFGHAITTSGSNVIVSASHATVNNLKEVGKVYVWNNFQTTGDDPVWSFKPLNTHLMPQVRFEWGHFAEFIKMSGDGRFMVVSSMFGKPGRSTGSRQAGIVYIFEKADDRWIQRQVLTPNESQTTSIRYGQTLAISQTGDWIVVGAPVLGKVFVYLLLNSTWVLQQTLFEASVTALAINDNGTRLAIGCSSRGIVSIYSQALSVWTQETSITSSVGFGADVVMTAIGDRFIARNSIDNTCQLYVQSGISWNLVQTISDVGFQYGSWKPWFMSQVPLVHGAMSVQKNGEILMVGTGDALKVFAYDGSTYTPLVSSSLGNPGIMLGSHMGMNANGDIAVLSCVNTDGASSGKIVTITRSGASLTVHQTLTTTDPFPYAQRWPYSVALSDDGTQMAYGCPLFSSPGFFRSGKVVTHSRVSGRGNFTSFPMQTIVPEDPESFMHFGSSVSATNEVIAVGAPFKSIDSLHNAGKTYVYRSNDLSSLTTLHAYDRSVGDTFGSSVSVSNSIVYTASSGKNSIYQHSLQTIEAPLPPVIDNKSYFIVSGKFIRFVTDTKVIASDGEIYEYNGASWNKTRTGFVTEVCTDFAFSQDLNTIVGVDRNFSRSVKQGKNFVNVVSGRVFIYAYASSTWQKKIDVSSFPDTVWWPNVTTTTNARVGYGVAMSSNATLLVLAGYDTTSPTLTVRTFSWDGTTATFLDQWKPVANDQFGGSYLRLFQRNGTYRLLSTSHKYFQELEWNGSTWTSIQLTLLPITTTSQEEIELTVSGDLSSMFIGAHSVISSVGKVFEYLWDGSAWTPGSQIHFEQTGLSLYSSSMFGYALSTGTTGDELMVGSYRSFTPSDEQKGHAHRFVKASGTWNQVELLPNPDTASDFWLPIGTINMSPNGKRNVLLDTIYHRS